MRKALFVLVAVALLGCATAALAQDQPVPPTPPAGAPMAGGFAMRMPGMGCPLMSVAPPQMAMIERMADQLALTDDQKTKLQAALTKSEDALKPLRAKSEQASKAIHEAIFAPAFDAAKVSQAVADAQKIETAIAASQIATWGEIRAILTADQVTKLSQSMARRMGGGAPGAGGVNWGTNRPARTGNRTGRTRNTNQPAPEPAPMPGQ